MLAALFGNRNLERILLFLFVNERCYGTQLQRLLRTPLTPLQKALHRLEKGKIIHSYYAGKTRFYAFNPDYPLRQELELLLKKAYTQLATHEKKSYCFIHKPRLPANQERQQERRVKDELVAFWERLQGVRELSFTVKSKQAVDTVFRTGKGEVTVERAKPTTLIFQEKGNWEHDRNSETAFVSSYRWSLDLERGLIGLEHLRHGPNHPVFIFHLASTGEGSLESVDSHLCRGDTYLGNVVWDHDRIRLHWRVIGDRKNDELVYTYL